MKDMSDKPRLTVLAGPTAVGKGTVSTYIREQLPGSLALRLRHHP